MPPSIEFSVVSGSNEALIVECLDSLYASLAGWDAEIAVTATCNTGGTGLADILRERFPGIRTVVNETSRGFAENHNTVLANSSADYVWLLNDDLVFSDTAVQKVTEFMESPGSERVAAVSPRLLNPDGSLQPSTYGFPSMPQVMLAHSGLRGRKSVEQILAAVSPVMRKGHGSSRFWAHDRTVDVDSFRGACVAVRMDAVRDAGLMAEVALVGGEEVEWHRRFRRRGWRVVFFAEASVVHHGSQSVGAGADSLYPEYLKSNLYYFRADSSAARYLALCTALLAMFSAKAALAWIRRDHGALDTARRYNRVTLAAVKERFARRQD